MQLRVQLLAATRADETRPGQPQRLPRACWHAEGVLVPAKAHRRREMEREHEEVGGHMSSGMMLSVLTLKV